MQRLLLHTNQTGGSETTPTKTISQPELAMNIWLISERFKLVKFINHFEIKTKKVND